MDSPRDTGIWEQWEHDEKHSVSPLLARLLEKIFIKSIPIVDYGCGKGFYVDSLIAAGFTVIGVEGTPDPGTIQADLSLPLTIQLPLSSSLSLEVGEHIPPEYEDVFIDNITKYCSGMLVLSWALPDQGGHRHVNERPNYYIIALLAAKGFYLNDKKTNFLRGSMHELDECRWFRNSLMVFDRL